MENENCLKLRIFFNRNTNDQRKPKIDEEEKESFDRFLLLSCNSLTMEGIRARVKGVEAFSLSFQLSHTLDANTIAAL